MRFFIITAILTASSISMAAIEGVNNLVDEAMRDERQIHNEMLRAMKDGEVSQAYNSQWQRLQMIEGKRQVKFAVNLRKQR